MEVEREIMTCTDKECCYHGQPKASSCECVNDKPQKRAGGPAFPQKLSFCDGGGIEYFGLSVRDYFAARTPAIKIPANASALALSEKASGATSQS